MNARALIERTGDHGAELLLQRRDKPGQRRQLELPGGQVEPYESLLDAVRREVVEETGLTVVGIQREDDRIVAAGEQATVECLRPFAVYQTLDGPVDSMGVYFRCTAGGELRPQQGETQDLQWIDADELRRRLHDDPEQFSWVDRAGLLSYLRATARPEPTR